MNTSRPMRTLGTAAAMLLAVVATAAAQSGKPSKVVPRVFTDDTQGVMALSGLASSARHCVGPTGSNVHDIGWVPASSQVTVTFSSDFDPVAAISVMQLGQDAPDRVARASFVSDDDSGGNLEPELRFTTSFPGTVVLHVSKLVPAREAGCYFYKVEVRTP